MQLIYQHHRRTVNRKTSHSFRWAQNILKASVATKCALWMLMAATFGHRYMAENENAEITRKNKKIMFARAMIEPSDQPTIQPTEVWENENKTKGLENSRTTASKVLLLYVCHGSMVFGVSEFSSCFLFAFAEFVCHLIFFFTCFCAGVGVN